MLQGSEFESLLELIASGEGWHASLTGTMGSYKSSLAVMLVNIITRAENGDCEGAYSFKPMGSKRKDIDDDTDGMRSRPGLELPGGIYGSSLGDKVDITPSDFVDTLSFLINGRYRIGVYDEVHMAGLALRPIIKAGRDFHKLGLVSVGLNTDFGGRNIATTMALNRMADMRLGPFFPRCAENQCPNLGTRNQLIIDGRVPTYDGFKAIAGDIAGEDNGAPEGEAKYKVFCKEVHWEEPRLAPNFNEIGRGIPLITDTERKVIAIMKERDLIPFDITEDYFLR
tara:strand:+ start:3741 stop:4589 length:849 start_codon:yes stop_codon:yes gene_type:complete